MKINQLVSALWFVGLGILLSAQLLAEQHTFKAIDRSEWMGIWSEDCSNPDEFFTLLNQTHVLTLSVRDDEVYYSELESSWLNDPDLEFELNQNELSWIFRTTGGDDIYIDQRCEQLPPTLSLLHGEAARFFFSSSGIATQCLSSREACAAAMMSTFDMANTGGLNEADIARLLRIATYFGTLDTWNSTASFEDLWLGQALAASVAPLLARTLIRNFDYDGDQQLSAQEIAMDRALFDATLLAPNATSGSGDRLREMLDQLEQLFLMFQ
jgi:hypothetical protein